MRKTLFAGLLTAGVLLNGCTNDSGGTKTASNTTPQQTFEFIVVPNQTNNKVNIRAVSTSTGVTASVFNLDFGSLPGGAVTHGSNRFFYVARQTNGGGVAGYVADAENGTVNLIAGSPFGTNPAYYPAIDPSGVNLYTSSPTAASKLVTYTISGDGTLTDLGGAIDAPGGLGNIVFTQGGHFLHSARQDNANIQTYARGTDGALAFVESTALDPGDDFANLTNVPNTNVILTATGGDTVRPFRVDAVGHLNALTVNQEVGAHIISTVVTTNNVVYGLDSVDSKVYGWTLDPATGTLTDLPNSPFSVAHFTGDTLSLDPSQALLFSTEGNEGLGIARILTDGSVAGADGQPATDGGLLPLPPSFLLLTR